MKWLNHEEMKEHGDPVFIKVFSNFDASIVDTILENTIKNRCQDINECIPFMIGMAYMRIYTLNENMVTRDKFNAKFDAINERFDSINSKFNELINKFDNINKRLNLIIVSMGLGFTVFGVCLAYIAIS